MSVSRIFQISVGISSGPAAFLLMSFLTTLFSSERLKSVRSNSTCGSGGESGCGVELAVGTSVSLTNISRRLLLALPKGLCFLVRF